jgi:Mrp family chromosome partitioning ATPase
VVGLIENMSGHVCGRCGHETDVFGSGGGEKLARELGIPFLGRIGLAA